MPRLAGNCNKICPCTRCAAGETPYTVTVFTDKVLTKWDSGFTVDSCQWKLGFDEIEDFGGGATDQYFLALIEAGATVQWLLLAWDASDEAIYQYSYTFVESDTCLDAQTLTETTAGGTGSTTLTPGAVRGACCPCEQDEEGSGSGSGGTCTFCSGDSPSQYQVVISGIANDRCSECNNLNGTWIVSRYACGLVRACCQWDYRQITNGCDIGGADFIYLRLVIYELSPGTPGSAVIVNVAFLHSINNAPIVAFAQTYGAKPIDCEFSSESIPRVTNSSECSGGTCVITAL